MQARHAALICSVAIISAPALGAQQARLTSLALGERVRFTSSAIPNGARVEGQLTALSGDSVVVTTTAGRKAVAVGSLGSLEFLAGESGRAGNIATGSILGLLLGGAGGALVGQLTRGKPTPDGDLSGLNVLAGGVVGGVVGLVVGGFVGGTRSTEDWRAAALPPTLSLVVPRGRGIGVSLAF